MIWLYILLGILGVLIVMAGTFYLTILFLAHQTVRWIRDIDNLH